MKLSPLTLLLGLLGGCGVASSQVVASSVRVHVTPLPRPPAKSVSIAPGQTRTFPPGTLQPGDVITCKVQGHRLHIRISPGTWSGFAGTATATPSGKGAELQASRSSNGSTTATCKG